MGRFRHAIAAAGLAAILCACDDAAEAPRPPAGATRAVIGRSEGDPPRMDTIVAREGDRLLVIVDVAAADAQGRAVESVAVAAPLSEDVVTTSSSAGPTILEVRVPASARELTVTGSSQGGARWSRTLPIALEAR